MENKIEVDTMMFKQHYEDILTYIDTYDADPKPTLEFLAALMISIIEKVKMTPDEIDLYMNVYSRILKKQFMEKEAEKLLTVT